MFIKKLISRLSVVSLFIVILLTTTNPARAAGDMIAYWRFNESTGNIASDSAGSHPGAIHGGATWTTGMVGNALSFNGIDGYVEVPNAPELNPQTRITIEGWVYIQKDGRDVYKLFDKDGYWSDQKGYSGHIGGGGTGICIEFFNPYRFACYSPAGGIPDQTWIHFAFTYDGSQIKLFYNGELANSVAATGLINQGATRDLYIGHTDSFSEFQKGMFDEFAIYDRALTAQEVLQDYHNGVAGLGYSFYTISGNVVKRNVTLSYEDNGPQTATSLADGSYSFSVSYNWSGTVTPSKPGYIFNPDHKDYTNVLADQTGQNYTAINPNIWVNPQNDRVTAFDWPMGAVVTLKIYPDSHSSDPDYQATQTITHTSPDDPNKTREVFNLTDVFDIKPGYVVSLSDATISLSVTATDVTITGYDLAADTVTGHAADNSEVDVEVGDTSNNASRYVTADGGGIWTADFSHTGIEPDEQTTFNIVPGDWLEAEQFTTDSVGRTNFDLNVPYTGTISGVVKDLSGNPITGVSIEVDALDKSDSSQYGTTCSNTANGTYTLNVTSPYPTVAVTAAGGTGCGSDSSTYGFDYWHDVSNLSEATPITLTDAAPGVTGIDLSLGQNVPNVEFLVFNYENASNHNGILQDLKVRQAIAYGTDRLHILDTAWLPHGIYGTVANTYVAEDHWAAATTSTPGLPVYPFNPELARSTLEGAGWSVGTDGIRTKGSQRLILSYITTDNSKNNQPGRIDTGPIFVQEMQDIGIKVIPSYIPPGTFWDTETGPLYTGQFDIAEFANNYCRNTLDETCVPSPMFKTDFIDNVGKYHSDSADAEYAAFQAASTHGERLTHALNHQVIVMNDLPALPLFTRLEPLTITGNTETGNATLTYTDGTVKTLNSGSDGSYTITVPQFWTGTITPSKPGYGFLPDHKDYNNVVADKTDENYSAAWTSIWVSAKDDTVEAIMWPMGNVVTLQIDNPSTPGDPDYADTQVITATAPWNSTRTYAKFDLTDTLDIKPGFVVRMSDGTISRSMTATDVTITGYDLAADTVTGHAADNSQVEVNAGDSSNNVSREVIANDNGIWTADFGHTGTGENEQNTFNIVANAWLEALQHDDVWDRTIFDLNVPYTGIISGVVKDLSGNPVTGVSIEVQAQDVTDGNQVGTTCSDSSTGAYTLNATSSNPTVAVTASGGTGCGSDTSIYGFDYWHDVSNLSEATPITLTSTAPGVTGIDLSLGQNVPNVEFLVFNFRDANNRDNPNSILQDLKVRQAIAYGTDRLHILDKAWLPHGIYGTVLNTYVADDHWAAANPSNSSLPDYSFDPNQARSLLDEAGWQVGTGGIRTKDGKRLSLKYITTNNKNNNQPERLATGPIFVQEMQDIGIEVIPEYVDPGTFWDTTDGPLYTGNFDIAEFANNYCRNTLDETCVPSPMFKTDFIDNVGKYHSDSADTEYADSQGVSHADRLTHALNHQVIVMNDLPALPLFTRLEPLTITGNTETGNATLTYTDGTIKTLTTGSDGSYTITVPQFWSGRVTPSKTGYTFSPDHKDYTNLLANHTSENYSALLNRYTLTYNAGLGGLITGASPQPVNYGSDGTTVTATPNAGYHFISWDDGVLTTSRTNTNVTADVTVTANFAINTYTLTYTAGTNGSIRGDSPQIVDYETSGSAVNAIPSTGYHFVEWSDHSTDNPRTDTNVTEDVSVIASFATDTHTITASAGAHGSISPSGSVSVEHGSDQTFNITVATKYHVADVLVDGSSVGAVTTYTFSNVTADHTIATNFATDTHTITASAGAHGSISPSGSVSVDHGSDQTFNITVATNYHVADVLVDGSSVGAVTTYTFSNVTADHTIATNFATDTHTITASAGAHGSISPSGSVLVDHGSDQTFNITVATNYHVADVLVDGSSVGAVTTYTFSNVTADHTIATNFATDTHTITASAGAHGSISPSGSVSVEHGSDQTFNITVATNYHVTDVLVDGSSVGAVTTYTFSNVTADHTIAASFATDTHTITASAGAHGSISPSGSVSVEHGSDQTFNITVATNYHVADVLVDGSSVGAVTTYTFSNVTADHTIATNFATDTHTITASAGAHGSISPSGSVSVEHGSDQTFNITVATNYHVTDVLVDGSSVGAVTTYTFSNVTADHTIAASFATDTHTITASAGAHGSISPSGSVSVEHGSDQTFNITVATNYHVTDVLVDGSSVGAVTTYTFSNVTADHTIAASFATDTHTITASAGAHGSISPSGSVSVEHGSDQTFNITVATNYHVTDVLVDGSSVGAVTTYTFSNVTADHTIAASFATDTGAPTVISFTVTSPTNRLHIPITAFTASDGVAGYKITTTKQPPSASDDGWTSTAPTTYAVTVIKTYKLYPWAKDAEGNVSAVYASPRTVVVTSSTIALSSISTHDGWILESNETSSVGGTINSTGNLILGDDSAKRQYRSILSFSTGASLPDNAVITAVTLKLKKQGVTGGGNPVSIFQGFMVDIKNGTFGTSALQSADFQTAASHAAYGPYNTALVAGFYTITLPSTAYPYINKLATSSGLTQLRLRFKLDDNNNAIANFLSLYSGNAASGSRPVLTIIYHLP